MSNFVSILGTKLINLMGISTVEDTDYLIVQKNTNGDQFTRKILWSDLKALLNVTEPIKTVAINYLAAAADNTILVDAALSAITITLPASIEAKEYTIKKIDSSANAVTIDPDGVETIDGNLTISTNTQWTSFTIKSDGSGWFIK